MNPAEVEHRRVEARVHLDFVIQPHEAQLPRGARFLHEHPASAVSGGDPGVKKLLERPEVHSGIGHMC
eukprot:10389004-Alexandrium_andersonii.AAC.1